MKPILYLALSVALSAPALVQADPRMPDEMMRGRSSQYQEGFRDGFREAVRMMNGGGNSGGGGNHWGRGIHILSAVYSSDRGGSCDLTRRLASQANGRSSFNFASNDGWCGDPAVGHVKYANIIYSCNGREQSVSVRQERSTTLRCY